MCPTKSQSTPIYRRMEMEQKKNIKKSRFPQWLGSVTIIQRRDYYYHYLIFLLLLLVGRGGGGAFVFVNFSLLMN